MKKTVLLFILCISTCVIADDNIEKARFISSEIKTLQEKATHDDVEAAYELGLAYVTGDGVKKDQDEAKKWLQLSAGQGHEPSKQLLDRLSQP